MSLSPSFVDLETSEDDSFMTEKEEKVLKLDVAFSNAVFRDEDHLYMELNHFISDVTSTADLPTMPSNGSHLDVFMITDQTNNNQQYRSSQGNQGTCVVTPDNLWV